MFPYDMNKRKCSFLIEEKWNNSGQTFVTDVLVSNQVINVVSWFRGRISGGSYGEYRGTHPGEDKAGEMIYNSNNCSM